MTRWYQYVRKATTGMMAKEAAERMGVNPSIMSNWKKGTQPSAKMVIQFARAVGESPLVALVEAGLLTPEEAGVRTVVRFEDRLVNLKTDQLLRELGRRAGV